MDKIYKVMIWEKYKPNNDIIKDFSWDENSDPEVVGKAILEMIKTIK